MFVLRRRKHETPIESIQFNNIESTLKFYNKNKQRKPLVLVHQLQLVNMFTKTLFSEAISSMKRLMNHPISNFFLDPVIPEPESGVEIANQIGLNDILGKLQNFQYKYIYEWMSDVETVFYNVEVYYSENSIAGCVAQEMRKIFNKERLFMMSYSVTLWTFRLTVLRSKLAELVHDSPHRVSSQMPRFAKVDTPNPRQLRFTSHEIQSFQIAFESIRTEQDKSGITSIINRTQPNIISKSANITLNQRLLSDESLIEIRNYLKECLRKNGLTYLE